MPDVLSRNLQIYCVKKCRLENQKKYQVMPGHTGAVTLAGVILANFIPQSKKVNPSSF